MGLELRVEYLPTPEGATDVVVYARTERYAVRLPLVPDADGTVDVERVELHRRDGRPLGARDMHKLGLGAINKALGYVLAEPIIAHHLGSQWGAVTAPYPGRRGRDDLFYAQAALEYVQALGHEPRRPVQWMVTQADESGELVTGDELRARLRRARERGLLTPAPRGRPGGALTDKATELLRDAGFLTDDEGDEGGER